MIRHKFMSKNGTISIFCITFQNGKIFKKILLEFSPKDELEASLLCFVLNESSRLDYKKVGYKKLNKCSQLH